MRLATMPSKSAPVILALLSAIAFTIAFISAGVFLLSFGFALLGSTAIALLVFVSTRRLLKRRLARRRDHDRLHSA